MSRSSGGPVSIYAQRKEEMMTDVVETMRELHEQMPLPERATNAMKLAIGEIVHLREQRDRLQERGSELVLERQGDVRARREKLINESLWREMSRLTKRVMLAEGLAIKLWDAYEGSSDIISDDEGYILEGADQAFASYNDRYEMCGKGDDSGDKSCIRVAGHEDDCDMADDWRAQNKKSRKEAEERMWDNEDKRGNSE
jgi:predicted small metal-binding protein